VQLEKAHQRGGQTTFGALEAHAAVRKVIARIKVKCISLFDVALRGKYSSDGSFGEGDRERCLQGNSV
jgi:hypothetical protein